MRTAVALGALALFVLAGLSPASGGPQLAGSAGDPTHLQLVVPGTATVGVDTTLMGVLHNSTSNQAIPGAALAFSIRTTFGWLPLGNGTTNAQGKAAVDFRPSEAGSFTVRVLFAGDASYAAANATTTMTVVAAPATQPPLIPTDTVIALIVLAIVGSIWATYGFVAWQVLRIRSAPIGARGREDAEFETTGSTEDERMVDEETKKSEPATKRNRVPNALAAVALVIGLAALALAGVSALPKAPAYTPGTIELQVAIVPDLKGEGWDAWVPNELVVHKGDVVKITVYNADEMEHGLKIAAFNVDQAIPGATANATGAITPSRTVITFTADQVGQFLIECNVVCGDGHELMTGTLVVLPD